MSSVMNRNKTETDIQCSRARIIRKIDRLQMRPVTMRGVEWIRNGPESGGHRMWRSRHYVTRMSDVGIAHSAYVAYVLHVAT